MRVRRHHCRFCYRLVCGGCSDHSIEIDGDGQQHRVCNQCFSLLGEQGLVGQGFPHGIGQESIFTV
jgi:hypothetical protein